MLKNVRVGDALPSIEKRIDQEDIMGWARISGDFNRLHVDPGYAGKSRFKGTIAHGPMSLAFLNRLMMGCLNEGWIKGGRLLDVRFVAPIRPGDRIKIGGTVKSVLEEESGVHVECDIFVEKETGEKAVVGRATGNIPGGSS